MRYGIVAAAARRLSYRAYFGTFILLFTNLSFTHTRFCFQYIKISLPSLASYFDSPEELQAQLLHLR